MSLYYLDSSAWVKRYFNESGSIAVQQLFTGQAEIAGCRFGLLEVICAIARRAHHEGIDDTRIASQVESARKDFAKFSHIEPMENVWDTSEIMWPKRYLRGADSLHLAVAATIAARRNEPIVFVTADTELAKAGELDGLKIFNPLTPC